jgi:hypothetical protein
MNRKEIRSVLDAYNVHPIRVCRVLLKEEKLSPVEKYNEAEVKYKARVVAAVIGGTSTYTNTLRDATFRYVCSLLARRPRRKKIVIKAEQLNFLTKEIK